MQYVIDPTDMSTETNLEVSQIRSLVYTALETDDLPDSVIRLDIFLGDANLELEELLPTFENFLTGGSSYSAENLKRLKSIVRKITAVKILSSIERKPTSGVDELSFSVDLLKSKDLIMQYKQEIVNSINYLRNSDTSSTTGRGRVAPRANVVDPC